jgi:hypothetical protein
MRRISPAVNVAGSVARTAAEHRSARQPAATTAPDRIVSPAVFMSAQTITRFEFESKTRGACSRAIAEDGSWRAGRHAATGKERYHEFHADR